MKPKLASSVSVVKLNETYIEFFKTNTRKQILIKIQDDTIFNIVNSLDGNNTIDDLVMSYQVDREEILKLVAFLENRGILDNVIPHNDFKRYYEYRRVINFLNDYSTSHNNLLEMWSNIIGSNVLIVGVGAVGTWVALNLIQSGLQNIAIMDADVVDISNLHRQLGFHNKDVGKKKIDVLEKRILELNPEAKVYKICEKLYKDTLDKLDLKNFDLIINCADKPTVDETSLWIGEYSMKYGIPHIVGGGYNLHLSLIGQTIIPGKTACVKCFEHQLEEDNYIDFKRVKKLAVKNRKVGSFTPMCSIIASLIGMESIKILTKHIKPANVNRRGEFDILTMDFKYKTYNRRDDCEWCGKNGIYYCK